MSEWVIDVVSKRFGNKQPMQWPQRGVPEPKMSDVALSHGALGIPRRSL